MAKIGNFEIFEELGRGAMGVVFRGLDPTIGRPVAIKVIRAQAFATNEEQQEARLRFAREATAGGRLSHPNIVTVYHFGEEGEYQYLAMEFVEGKALEGAAPAQCLSILRQVAGALDYAHAHGVIHRDIKPANVLVRTDGQVKLTDFGIARIASQTVTQSGVTMGTPSYMAPEQVMASRVDGKADQFSLAVIAFELLAGRKPFNGTTSQAVLFAIVQGERPAAHEVNQTLPPAVSEILKKGLAKDAGDRFPTCSEFIAALEAAFCRSTGAAFPPNAGLPVSPQPTLPHKRYGLGAALGSVALATAAIVGVYAFIHNSPERASSSRAAAVRSSTKDVVQHGDLDSPTPAPQPPATFLPKDGASRGTATSSRAGSPSSRLPARQPDQQPLQQSINEYKSVDAPPPTGSHTSSLRIGKIDISRFAGVTPEDMNDNAGKAKQKAWQYSFKLFQTRVNPNRYAVEVDEQFVKKLINEVGSDPLLDLIGKSMAKAILELGEPSETLRTPDGREVVTWSQNDAISGARVALSFSNGICIAERLQW